MQTIKTPAGIPTHPGSLYIFGAPRVCEDMSVHQLCLAQQRGTFNLLRAWLLLQLRSAKNA